MGLVKVRSISEQFREEYNRVVTHPLQAWEWGEFRQQTGVKVIRRGIFANNTLVAGFQLTIHHLPRTPWKIGYLPKGQWPDGQLLQELVKIGSNNNCIFIKLEPDVDRGARSKIDVPGFDLRESPHPLFTKFTFHIDLLKDENALLGQMKPKTRYNIRLAQKKGVTVVEDNSATAFAMYLHLLQATAKRQGFYAHNEEYHRQMWEKLHPAGIAHLLKAVYKKETLAMWIIFLFNRMLYYPYGASSDQHRNLMASNLLLWEAIRWGKQHRAKVFDLWGALGPKPDKTNPHYGFHRFKAGYGGALVELVGSYDLVLQPLLYRLYNFANRLRWSFLHRRMAQQR